MAVFVALLSPEAGADVVALFVVDSLSSTSILEAGEVVDVLGAATEAAAARVSGSVVRFSMATVTLENKANITIKIKSNHISAILSLFSSQFFCMKFIRLFYSLSNNFAHEERPISYRTN